MFATFDLEIKDKGIFDNFLIQGNDEFKKNRKHVKNALDKYLLKNDIIDGDAISQDWFPNINSNIL